MITRVGEDGAIYLTDTVLEELDVNYNEDIIMAVKGDEIVLVKAQSTVHH